MVTTASIDQVFHPSSTEVDLARRSVPVLTKIMARCRVDAERVQFLDEEDEQVVIPVSALELLKGILVQMAQGNAMIVIPIHAELTTQQAADILNVSRPYLVKLLEAGEIPFTKKGTHRRVLFKNIMDYKHKIDEQRMQVLDELTAQAQELDMGY